MVFSQGWPSWSFALDGLGFASVSTSASFPSVTSREEFLVTELGPSLISHASVNRWVSRHDSDGIIFVQGDSKFLDSVYSITDFENTNLRLLYICSDTNFPFTKGQRISHEEAGGITDGVWTWFSKGLEAFEVRVSTVKRNLRHVLSKLESSSSLSSLKRVRVRVRVRVRLQELLQLKK